MIFFTNPPADPNRERIMKAFRPSFSTINPVQTLPSIKQIPSAIDEAYGFNFVPDLLRMNTAYVIIVMQPRYKNINKFHCCLWCHGQWLLSCEYMYNYLSIAQNTPKICQSVFLSKLWHLLLEMNEKKRLYLVNFECLLKNNESSKYSPKSLIPILWSVLCSLVTDCNRSNSALSALISISVAPL